MDPRRHRHRLRAVLSKLNNETVAKAVFFFVERLRFFDIQPAVQVKYGNFLFVFTPLRGVKTRVNSRFCFLYSTRCAGWIRETFYLLSPHSVGTKRRKRTNKICILFTRTQEYFFVIFPLCKEITEIFFAIAPRSAGSNCEDKLRNFFTLFFPLWENPANIPACSPFQREQRMNKICIIFTSLVAKTRQNSLRFKPSTD